MTCAAALRWILDKGWLSKLLVWQAPSGGSGSCGAIGEGALVGGGIAVAKSDQSKTRDIAPSPLLPKVLNGAGVLAH
jgi:hypothetical protein